MKRRVCKDARGADGCHKRVEKVYVGERKRHGRRSEKQEAIVEGRASACQYIRKEGDKECVYPCRRLGEGQEEGE
jgi:hypothetical protein